MPSAANHTGRGLRGSLGPASAGRESTTVSAAVVGEVSPTPQIDAPGMAGVSRGARLVAQWPPSVGHYGSASAARGLGLDAFPTLTPANGRPAKRNPAAGSS